MSCPKSCTFRGEECTHRKTVRNRGGGLLRPTRPSLPADQMLAKTARIATTSCHAYMTHYLWNGNMFSYTSNNPFHSLPLLVIEELGFAKESTLIQADSIQVSQVFFIMGWNAFWSNISQLVQMISGVAFLFFELCFHLILCEYLVETQVGENKFASSENIWTHYAPSEHIWTNCGPSCL